MATETPADAPRLTQRDRNRQQTRAAIMRAAQVLLMRDGTSASMVEVAELAGVSDTTVFNYFKTKTDLLDAVLEELGSATNFAAQLAGRPASEGPLTALRNLIQDSMPDDAVASEGRANSDYLQTVRADPALWGAYLRINHQSGELLAAAYAERAPHWTPLHARLAAHTTVTALATLLEEVDEHWSTAQFRDQIDDVLTRLALAWPE